MGASIYATVLPGRAISLAASFAEGWTTLTTGIAASRVALATLFSATTRERMPKKTTRAMTAAAIAGSHQEIRSDPVCGGGETSVDLRASGFGAGNVVTFPSSFIWCPPWSGMNLFRCCGIALAVQEAEYRGYKNERCDGGAEQTADDRATERRILLAAIAEAEGHGNHADDHGQGGHE